MQLVAALLESGAWTKAQIPDWEVTEEDLLSKYNLLKTWD